MSETTGRKEDVITAVIIAAATAIVTGLANIGVEEVKRVVEKRREQSQTKPEPKDGGA